MRSEYDERSPRTVFETGSLARVSEEVERLNKKRIILVSDESAKNWAEQVNEQLGELVVQHIDHVVMHVPDEFSAPIVDQSKKLGIDLVISIGGGSATGLGKILALDVGVDLLAIPTTYAGSEMTTIWGRTRNGEKLTGRNQSVMPKTVIYDPALTYSLPLNISANSGMNAIAHAVEAMYAPNCSPEVESASLEGIEIFSKSLRTLVRDTSNNQVRSDLFRGSMLCGFALNNATMGIHHKICHTLGGFYNLPHAQMHSAVLPHAVHFNQSYASKQLDVIASTLNAKTAADGLWQLASDIGSETSLKNIGYHVENSDHVAEFISNAKYENPRPFNYEGVVGLLKNAFNGDRPHDES